MSRKLIDVLLKETKVFFFFMSVCWFYISNPLLFFMFWLSDLNDKYDRLSNTQ